MKVILDFKTLDSRLPEGQGEVPCDVAAYISVPGIHLKKLVLIHSGKNYNIPCQMFHKGITTKTEDPLYFFYNGIQVEIHGGKRLNKDDIDSYRNNPEVRALVVDGIPEKDYNILKENKIEIRSEA